MRGCLRFRTRGISRPSKIPTKSQASSCRDHLAGDRDHETTSFRIRWRSPMLYSSIVEKRIRETFEDVNNHRWKEAVKAVAPHVHHRVSGDHALGGERHNK